MAGAGLARRQRSGLPPAVVSLTATTVFRLCLTKREANGSIRRMRRRRATLSDQVRRAINGSGMSRYALCKEIELSQSTMSRFMAGKGGLSMDMLDRLGLILGLKIVATRAGDKKEG
jgi:ribosome-binding protein aMBF1 (putative translation factor)